MVSGSMRLLDRYVLQNFVTPFAYSTLGFLAIWLVFDLSDKGHDFIEAHIKLKTLAYFYLTQFPQILVICLPVGLLLALLYSLSRMSRSNEIISMLTAGCSVLRVMLPLFIFGRSDRGDKHGAQLPARAALRSDTEDPDGPDHHRA